MLLTFDQYQRAAEQTAVYPAISPTDGVIYCALGLAGEAGEIANQAKKIMRDDGFVLTPERRKKMLDELGDCLWYAASLANELNAFLGQAAADNLVKLAKRAEEGTLQGDDRAPEQ